MFNCVQFKIKIRWFPLNSMKNANNSIKKQKFKDIYFKKEKRQKN